MTTQILKSEKRSLDAAEAVQEIERGRLEAVHVHDAMLTRATLEPGWRWSQHVRPLIGTDSCQVQHIQYVLSGRLTIRMDDGSHLDLQAGDFAVIAPGHDAWVVGDEPFVAVDFSPEMQTYVQEEQPQPHSHPLE